MNDTVVEYLYILAIVFFVVSLKWMSEVKTSRYGNWIAASGMAVAIGATLLAYQVQRVDLLVGAVIVGTVIGIPIALRVPMTAVPQRTAVSHAFGSLAVALVGTAEYYQSLPNIDVFTYGALSGDDPRVPDLHGQLHRLCQAPGADPWEALRFGRGTSPALQLLASQSHGRVVPHRQSTHSFVLPLMAFFALLFGFLLVMAIGGADMPTVIAILNSYAGMSAAALGFVLDNQVLIVAGALDGSSGFILAMIMSKAMNRSFTNVLFGGVGAPVAAISAESSVAGRTVQAYTVEDVATVLENAKKVVFVPGYGMAVAQAQHVVKEVADMLQASGTEVKYGIHPVAGRMPGHMNVLLAEAQVPYDELWEMDRVNPLFPETDVAIVVGANDVTNPAARTRPDSPLYGMPILNVDKAKTVVFIKRSMAPGFAGVENELFYLPNTMMVFGDAKKVLTDLMAALKKR